MKKQNMKRPLMVAAALLAVGACEPDFTVPNLNNPSAGGDATVSSVLVNAQGLMSTSRSLTTQGITSQGMWGRESYTLAPQEPRPYVDNLIGPRDPSSFGVTFFGTNYSALADIESLLASLEVVEGLSDAEKEAIRGWAKTVEAFSYFQLAVHHQDFGAPIDAPDDPTGELAPLASSAELYERALNLFDEGQAHLQAAGSTFPFQLTAGYAPFNTPAAFIEVNRALKARTLKYMGRWNDVLTALEGSFIDATADLGLGVYHTYSLADGNSNPFANDDTDYLHPRFLAGAQDKPDGTPDDRALEKAEPITPVTVFDVTVSEVPTIYPDPESPFPWITNEELLLLRAEARLATGDVPGALADVNVVRTEAGGLAPLASVASDEALLDEILYNKFYSLIWEGGFTILDAMQYDRIDELPRSLPEHVVFTKMNYPANECLARDLTDGACGIITGIP
ncbi:MAG TPA: hypothetical protein VFI91_14470 [Longimicrobiaceae bacterium]|nr:hypothetical protein [Longimicrobiaceae bacterium]